MHGVLVLFEGINSCTVLPNSRSKDKSATARHLNVNQVPLYKMISHISLCKQSKEHGYTDFCASIFMCFSRFFYKLKKRYTQAFQVAENWFLLRVKSFYMVLTTEIQGRRVLIIVVNKWKRLTGPLSMEITRNLLVCNSHRSVSAVSAFTLWDRERYKSGWEFHQADTSTNLKASAERK